MYKFLLILIVSSMNVYSQEYVGLNFWQKIEKKKQSKVKNYQDFLKKRIGSYNIKEKNKLVFKQVKVAVIDTGIDTNNPSFQNRVVRKNASIKDNHGHGSHVTGLITLLTEKERPIIYPFKFYESYYTSKQTVDLACDSLRKAIDLNVDIINLSLGGVNPSEREKELIKEAERKGIIVVAASGNNGSNLDYDYNTYYPASYKFKNIISVANYKNRKELDKSSNYSKKNVTVGTIGTSVPSFGTDYNNDYPTYMTGTSQATPLITSVIVKLKTRYPYMTLSQIKHVIKVNSVRNEDTQYGYFDYYSFTNWMNKNYNYLDINPKKKISFSSDSFFNYYVPEMLNFNR